jgi:hypothetical protein
MTDTFIWSYWRAPNGQMYRQEVSEDGLVVINPMPDDATPATEDEFYEAKARGHVAFDGHFATGVSVGELSEAARAGAVVSIVAAGATEEEATAVVYGGLAPEDPV